MTFTPEVWDGVVRRLRRELPAFTCEAWIDNLVAAPAGSSITLVCPTPFHRDRIRDNYLESIRACVTAEMGHPLAIHLDVGTRRADGDGGKSDPRQPVLGRDSSGSEREPLTPRDASTVRSNATPIAARGPARRSLPTATTPRAGAARSSARTSARPHPHAQHTFDSFVVGDCNALAREASLAVVRDAGPNLTQLYIWSPPGLGKTHLARAVCAEARANGHRPVYTSAEAFTNEFLASLRSHQMDRFKRKFRRDCDLLVVEDVQFLEGKQSTQLEFFHSVQHVLDAGGRVVVTGSKLPHSLSALEPRVRSQVAGGFVTELGPPDAQVRRKLLREKASAGGVGLPDDCLDLLVDSIRGSVRDVEGVLIQLVTTASLLKRPIDVALCREALEKKGGIHPASHARRLEPAAVLTVVAAFFKTTQDVMSSKSRRREVLLPRQLAMYLCHKYTDASLVEIGRALGRDHPAVRNAVTKIERKLLESAPLRYQIEALIERLDERLVRSPGR